MNLCQQVDSWPRGYHLILFYHKVYDLDNLREFFKSFIHILWQLGGKIILWMSFSNYGKQETQVFLSSRKEMGEDEEFKKWTFAYIGPRLSPIKEGFCHTPLGAETPYFSSSSSFFYNLTWKFIKNLFYKFPGIAPNSSTIEL